jgi:hypothetical protein
VAALNPEKYNQRELYLRPAGLAAIGIFLIAGAVVAKIIREHKKFAALKAAQNAVYKKLKEHLPDSSITPDQMFSDQAGRGYIWSLAVVIAAALAGIGFCLSVIGTLS